MTGGLATRAGALAWQHDLRGYDAVPLAAALAWQDTVEDAEDEIIFACFGVADVRRVPSFWPRFEAGCRCRTAPKTLQMSVSTG